MHHPDTLNLRSHWFVLLEMSCWWYVTYTITSLGQCKFFFFNITRSLFYECKEFDTFYMDLKQKYLMEKDELFLYTSFKLLDFWTQYS